MAMSPKPNEIRGAMGTQYSHNLPRTTKASRGKKLPRTRFSRAEIISPIAPSTVIPGRSELASEDGGGFHNRHQSVDVRIKIEHQQ